MIAAIETVARVTRTLEATNSVLTQLRAAARYLTLVNVYNRSRCTATIISHAEPSIHHHSSPVCGQNKN